MENYSSPTRARLAALSDAGVFECLAAAVLRQANPLYRQLVETGTNADGKAVASPVDGLLLVPNSSPPHLVAIHHTSNAQQRLRGKWLSRAAESEGDLPKTARWAATARQQLPDARVTLVLTTNRMVPPKLYIEVQAQAAANGLELDIWDQSLLADHLDNSAEGQWLRRGLSLPPARMSVELLAELSARNLDAQPRFDNDGERIPRTLDGELARAAESARNILFVISEAGQGKTSAVQALLLDNAKRGGFSFVLPHQDLERSLTLASTFESVLRRLEPSLAEGCGAAAIALATPQRQLLFTVEDVNHAARPAELVERLAGWLRAERRPSEGNRPFEQALASWRLICPLRPQALDGLSEQGRRRVLGHALSAGPFTPEEGGAAVLRRANARGVTMTPMQAAEIAAAFGQDPLMIALHDPQTLAGPQSVMAEFVSGCLSRIPDQAKDRIGPSDFRVALFRLCCAMLSKRLLAPCWSNLRDWFTDDQQALHALNALASRRELIWRAPAGDDDDLMFRHDCVRDYLLADAIARQMQENTLSDGVLSDPFYAELAGAALASSREIDTTWAARVEAKNPLGLFHALKLSIGAGGPMCDAVLSSIRSWQANPGIHAVSQQHLTWAAAQALGTIDSPVVLELCKALPDSGWPIVEARFRNGDAVAGSSICYALEPGVSARWLDRLSGAASDSVSLISALQFGQVIVGSFMLESRHVLRNRFRN
jgi:hypothetical protein